MKAFGETQIASGTGLYENVSPVPDGNMKKGS
jgi:hypothetical protein